MSHSNLPSRPPLPPGGGLVLRQPIIVPSEQSLDQLAALLNQAQRATLLCGGGCEGAH